MPYPPELPPADQNDGIDAKTGVHDGVDFNKGHHAEVLHNRMRAALVDIIAELGNDPSGTFDSVEARLASQERLAVPRRAGRWHSSPATELALNTALTLDRAYFMPFPVFDPITVDGIGAWANTSVAGAFYTLALFDSTADGVPGPRLELSPALDAAVAGNKIHGFATRVLPRRLYWVSLVNTGAANASIGYAASGNEWVNDGLNAVASACYYAGGGAAALTDPAPANLTPLSTFINVLLRAA